MKYYGKEKCRILKEIRAEDCPAERDRMDGGVVRP